MSVTRTDEVYAAATEVAALFRDNYMVPNTWPAVLRFVAAVEALALASSAPAEDQSQSQSSSQAERANAERQTPNADDEPERQSRAPLS